MRGFSGLSDFFLRKAFKFALKRNLGKYLASELDLNQLDVQLGQGTIELRQLLLNCTELNEQLVSQTIPCSDHFPLLWCILSCCCQSGAVFTPSTTAPHSYTHSCTACPLLLICVTQQKTHPVLLPAELSILGDHCRLHRQCEGNSSHHNSQHRQMPSSPRRNPDHC